MIVSILNLNNGLLLNNGFVKIMYFGTQTTFPTSNVYKVSTKITDKKGKIQRSFKRGKGSITCYITFQNLGTSKLQMVTT